MKKILRSTLVCAALGMIGLAACDAVPPWRTTPSEPVGSKAVPPGETLADVVRRTLAEIVRDQDPYSRARRLGALLPTLGPDAVPAVRQQLEDPTIELTATDFELLLRYWATYEPETASRWAATQTSLNYRPAAVFSALSTWTQADPQAAVAVAWPWTDIIGLETIVPTAVVRGWYAAGEPAKLERFLRSLPLNVLGQRTISAYARVLIEREGVDAVRRWAEGLPERRVDDRAYKLTVFRRVVDALSQVDIESAARWCDVHCEGPYGSNMRSLISRNWVLRDGPAAMAWLEASPPGYERDVAVRVTFLLWGRTDRKAALAWMAAQNAGEPPAWLRPTYAAYARFLAADAPLEALKWSERIEDDREREESLIEVATMWRRLDEAAAESWLLQSPLSEEARQRARGTAPKEYPKLAQ